MSEMDKVRGSMAQQIAQAASEFEHLRTGHLPASVNVVLGGDTLVITVHGCLSPVEKALAMNSEGAAQIREFHRQLFLATCGTLRQQIKAITGVDVREATAEIEAEATAEKGVGSLLSSTPADARDADDKRLPTPFYASPGAIAHVFTNGVMVQVFLLDGNVVPDTWSSAHSQDWSRQKGTV